jgi:cyanate permease
VDGTKLTPQFLAGAAVMMQISIANVFLPQVIKNDKTLRWVQIASGITMTLIQSATLFAGKPTPYYATFSAFEIGATTFITINALKWKPKSGKQLP